MIDFLREHLDEKLFEAVAAALADISLPSLAKAEDEAAVQALAAREAAISEKERQLAEKEQALEKARQQNLLLLLFSKTGAADAVYLCDKLSAKAVWNGEELANGEELVELAKKLHPALFPLPKVEGVKPADVPSAAEVPFHSLTLTERLKLFQLDPAAYDRRRC